MDGKNVKAKRKTKATINNKSTLKKKKTTEDVERMNSRILLGVTFLTGVLLLISTYAWLSASLNVKIKFFDLSVSSDHGLFISLDGIDFTSSVEISMNSVITDLKATYPQHTNQWSSGGLWPVSSNGIKTRNNDKFAIYVGEVSRFKSKETNRRYLNTRLSVEDNSYAVNSYIAFDMFLKNVSGSPKSDNLFIEKGPIVDFDEDTDEDIRESMSNIINSMRFGFVRIGSVSSKSDVKTIQNMRCNNNCQVVIYEPNSTVHTDFSIEKAGEHGITLENGLYAPTYAVIKNGDRLEHVNGHAGTGVPLDTEHFALQKTISDADLGKPIFQIPNGITKVRAYVWIEGQDVDSLETNSKGAAIAISMNLIKDLTGYE